MNHVAVALLVVGGLWCHPVSGQPSSKDEEAIRANVNAYVAAYRKKDASALAEFWAEDGRFVSPVSGEVMSGREKIRKEYAAMFEESPKVALEVKVESLRFLTANVVVEEGTATVVVSGEVPSESTYQVIHKKRDGKWLIDSVRETVVASEPAGEEAEGETSAEMKALAWMIGDWIDEGEDASIYLSCSWGLGRKFLIREFDVAIEDRIEMSGIEVIGWDPAGKRWRSWVFDSEGGFGSAVWSKEGKTLTKELTGTTKSGQKAFATQTIVKVDDNTYQWRAHGRELDGELLPNIETVTVVRQTENENENENEDENGKEND